MRRLLLAVILLLTPLSAGGADPLVPILNISGPIGPATADYVDRGLEQARELGAEVVVLRIDTPGGLDTAMREIIKSILSSSVPVAAYVAPSGARAASAGTFILYASHVAAMAPGTNVGAATPVPLGLPSPLPSPPRPERQPEKDGEPGEEQATDDAKQQDPQPQPAARPTMSEKVVSDAAAYIRSLARMRGRNADWAEKAVREAASLGAEEALEIGVIDIVAATLEDLLKQLDGRNVVVLGQARTLTTKEARTVEIEADWRTELLAVITNPNVAYILMLVGIYGLMFEFINPGALVPGIVGAVCLVLALYALNVLPINYAGLALMLLGIGLMTAEVFAPSFGMLGIGGVAAFAIGSVILFEPGAPHFEVSWAVVGAVALSSLAFSMMVIAMAVKARWRPVVTGRQEMIGTKGHVVEWSGRTGRVRTHGEIWQASARTPLEPGQEIRVASLEDLTLEVEPLPKKDEQ